FLRNSIKYGLEHEQEAIDYAMEYSRGKSRQLIEKFVKMYVNDVTVDMGNPGEKSIRRLFELAAEKNLVSNFDLRIAE
ncbi:MAG: MqnA/MqnD/SBP family protein, partial [Nitrosopumilaceae archaeon]